MRNEQPFDRINKHTLISLVSCFEEKSVKRVFFTLGIQFHLIMFQRFQDFFSSSKPPFDWNQKR
jgi:hypothetical protein